MTEVRTDQVYIARKVITGENESGKWELVIVQAPGNYEPRIAISVINPPSHIGANGLFKITSIYSVMHRKRKFSSRKSFNELWMEGSVTVRAKVEALGQLSPEEMEQVVYKEVKPELPSLEDLFG